MKKFEKYYKKNRIERVEILKDSINEKTYEDLINSKVLSNEIASSIIENQISILGLPLGLATNFCINGKDYVIPMAIEEPSVIAAASNAAKILGNIEVQVDKRLTIGQIALYDVEGDINKVYDKKSELLNLANSTQEMLVSLGGGARDIKIEKKENLQ